MDKNTVIGFILIAIVVIGFGYFSQPSKEELAQRRTQDSIAAVNAQKEQNAENEKARQETAERMAQQAAALDSTTLFGGQTSSEGKIITLQNELVKIDINTKGGNVASVELKKYKNQQKKNVELFNEHTAELDYILALKTENIHTKDYVFTPTEETDSTLSLVLSGKDGSSLQLEYKLLTGTYMLNLTLKGEGLEKHFAPNQQALLIDWKETVMQQEKGFDFENRYATLTYKKRDKNNTKYLSENKQDEKNLDEALDWIAYKNQFFSSVMIGYQDFTNVKLQSIPMAKGSGFLKKYHASMQTAFDPTGAQPTTFQLYYGPNQYQLLQKMNKYSLDGKKLKLENLVYLGWPIIRWINRYFTIYLFSWLTNWGFSMGVVLLLLTLLLKILVYPTTKKSYMSSAKMRVLKPKLDEIQKKYPNKEDAMKMQQEIMTTYNKYGVSPMSGCLPVLLQTPIWIAMFNFVPNAIELRGQKFLWSDDLSTYDSIIQFKGNLPLIGDHISLFCVLFCATNLLYSWLNMKMQKDSMVSSQAAQQMKMMQWMMMLMPIFFFFMFNTYSAGLNYYYWISLLFSAITMWYLRWRTDDKKLLEKLEKNYERNAANPQKMKGLAARLEAMQKQQEQMKNRKR